MLTHLIEEFEREEEMEFDNRFIRIGSDGCPELKINDRELAFIADLQSFIRRIRQEGFEEGRQSVLREFIREQKIIRWFLSIPKDCKRCKANKIK